MGKYPVVTLCGSTRFKDKFLEMTQVLTLQGYIVISVGVFGHADGVQLSEQQKSILDDMHKAKIDMANEIFVINQDGYIGNSTKGEIDYAIACGKGVRYLEPLISLS